MDESEARKILAIDGDATEAEVRTAYRRALMRWHPDRFAEDRDGAVAAAEETRRIITAYRALSRELVPRGDLDQGIPSFWRQLNPFDASHYRYSPNTVWDGVAIAGIIVVGLILLIVFGT